MISIDQAWQQLSAHFKPAGSETVELARAWGRVTAEPICSLVDKPEVALSAMDGYAVRSVDTQGMLPVVLQQIDEVPAGRSFEGEIVPGESVRIFTGAPLPADSDAVVRQEDAIVSGQQITIKVEARAGDHIRPAGSDFRASQPLLMAGQLITARVITLAASAGITWIKVRRRPRVAILATGDELIMPGQLASQARFGQARPGRGGADGRGVHQIVNASSPGLAVMIEAWGGQAVQLGIAGDDRDQLTSALDNADKVDLVVSIGGASVGDYDLMHSLFESPNDEVVFWQVAMRPGKPLLFGRRGANLILGLPGNPVSAMVCALVFLQPLMGLLLGRGGAAFRSPPEMQRLGSSLAANDHRQSYLRARLAQDVHGEIRVMPFAPAEQDSAILSSLAAADCLVVRAPHTHSSKAGELVEIIRFPGSCWRC